ncbi:MAG: Sjogren's syndrome/scleroderma autoantigen 1 family protein [Euryarchaeota archaeon]|nr:Sjogren's syndrome/scleroderma autoantigen 1 family protein [Euryarchaeota archaeon]
MDEIDVMSRMLERGGTMLAATCERCGAPMFRYQGKTGCPTCDFMMLQDEGAEETGKIGKTQGAVGAGEAISGIPLRDVVSDKIAKIAVDMQNETDLGRIRDQMDCIERGIRIMGLLG